MKPPQKALTTNKAARVVGWSPSTMLRALQDGKVKAFRTPGGHYRVRREDLEGVGGMVVPSRESQVKVLGDAIRWALSEGDPFNARSRGETPVWWRAELRKRARMPLGKS